MNKHLWLIAGIILVLCVGLIAFFKPSNDRTATASNLAQATIPNAVASLSQPTATASTANPSASATTHKDFNALVYGDNAKTTTDTATHVSGVNEDGTVNANTIAYNDPASDPNVKPHDPQKDMANQLADSTFNTPASVVAVR